MKKKSIIIIVGVSTVAIFAIVLVISLNRYPEATLTPVEQGKIVDKTSKGSAKESDILKDGGKENDKSNAGSEQNDRGNEDNIAKDGSNEWEPTQDKNWKVVEQYDGKKSASTESFHIVSNKWKVAWSVIGEKGKESRCFVYEKGEDEHPIKEIKVRRIGPQGSTGYLGEAEIEKAGNFYFKIKSQDCQWKIFVSELDEKKK